MRKIEEKDLLKQNKLSADEYQKAKKLKGFNKADYSFDANKQLYTKKENLITITQEIKIGENILEPGDKIKIITESKKLKEEFIETMYSTKGSNVVFLLDEILNSFSNWKDSTYKNFSDSDAKEWGHRNLDDAVHEAKEEITEYLENGLNIITR